MKASVHPLLVVLKAFFVILKSSDSVAPPRYTSQFGPVAAQPEHDDVRRPIFLRPTSSTARQRVLIGIGCHREVPGIRGPGEIYVAVRIDVQAMARLTIDHLVVLASNIRGEHQRRDPRIELQDEEIVRP
jgi:hypothetical protein